MFTQCLAEENRSAILVFHRPLRLIAGFHPDLGCMAWLGARGVSLTAYAADAVRSTHLAEMACVTQVSSMEYGLLHYWRFLARAQAAWTHGQCP